MKVLIKKVLKEVEITTIYAVLCNKYADVDNGMNFKKNEVIEILNKLSIKLISSPRDKMFYQDYFINDYSIRFLLPYQYGFIDCCYVIYNEKHTLFTGGIANLLCEFVDEKFIEKIKYKFPIATSINDLEDILGTIIKLHNDFISLLSNVVTG